MFPACHLRVDGLSKSFPDRRALTDVSLVVSAGERVAIIGENGSGKSTLLRIIGGVLDPDAGSYERVGNPPPSCGLLHQDPPFGPEATLEQAVEEAVRETREAERALDAAAISLADSPDSSQVAAYSAALERAEWLDVWGLDSRIDQTLEGLGLSDIQRARPTGALSGGERARLSLACVLLARPDILLLDEPTNHLDDSAAAFLRDLLLGWRGPVLVASHDRAFLDEIATSLIDLDPSPTPHALQQGQDAVGVTRYTGNYTDYLAVRADERSRWQHQFEQEQAELARLRASVGRNQHVGKGATRQRTEVRSARKFYADRNAKVVARRVNDARSRLEALEERQIAKPPKELRFAGLNRRRASDAGPRSSPVAGSEGAMRAGSDGELGGGSGMVPGGSAVAQHATSDTVLALERASVKGRLAETSLDVATRARLLVTGRNGSGKSTLLALLAGRLEPTSGSVLRAAGIRVDLLAQEVAFAREAHMSATQWYSLSVGEELASEIPLRSLGLLAGRDEHRRIADLSVGQQRRLALARILADPPDVLLLDEPTNHLSLALVTDIEREIPNYHGAVVVASHDRWLRERWRYERINLG